MAQHEIICLGGPAPAPQLGDSVSKRGAWFSGWGSFDHLLSAAILSQIPRS